MPETLNVRPRGLYLGASDPQTPPGAMSAAGNVVISRDGIVETRRGLDVVGTKALSRVWAYKDGLVGYGSTVMSRSTDGITWTDYATTLAPPVDVVMRALEAQGCLFATTSEGPYRFDSFTTEPVQSGVPEGLDVGLALSTASGTAVPTANQLAYRVVFGRKDGNGRLILGGPSSRGVIANTSGSTKDIVVSATLPAGLSSTTHFAQIYRTKASGGSAVEPGDEMGLVYEAAIPAVSSGTQLVRTLGTTVTATTSAAHGYQAGQQVRISPGGISATSAVALGASSAIQRSTNNGDTWSSAGITGLPAGDYYAICFGGAQYVVFGRNGGTAVCATSPDGLTWTSRTLSTGIIRAACWTGTRYVGVGDNGAIRYSTDGITWNTGSGGSDSYWLGVAWNGTQVVAVGRDIQFVNQGRTMESSDGITFVQSGVIAGFDSSSASNAIRCIVWDASSGSWVIGGSYGSSRRVARSTAAGSSTSFTVATGVSGTGAISALTNDGTAILAYDSDAYKSTDDGVSFSAITWASGTVTGACWDGTKHIAVCSSGTNAANATSNPSSLTARTITSATYAAVAAAGVEFAPGEYTIATVPLTTTFTYAQAGSNGTLTATQVITPLSVTVTDTAPDGFFGAALYTNANQQGILAANARPPLAKEIASFRGSVFYAHVTTPALATIYLLGCSGTNGLAVNDTITVNGTVYTAKAAESVTNREFAVTTTGTAAVNIRDTAGSLVRVLNRSASSGVYAQDVSDPSGTPGQIAVWCRDASVTLTVDVSKPSAWAQADNVSVAPKEWKNGLTWSKTDQPDHVSKSLILGPEQIGAADAAILRCVPTRSSLFIFKEDGLWRLTGDGGAWDIQPFDPTVKLIAPESAVTLDNTVYALCDAGVLRVSDTGVSLVSRQPGACDVEPYTKEYALPASIDSVSDSAFGIAYEEEHKYLMVVPTFSDFLVYDVLTRAWTTWDPEPAHGCILGGYLWLVGDGAGGDEVRKEAKAGSDDDCRDYAFDVTILAGGGTTSLSLISTAGTVAGGMVGTAVIREVFSSTVLIMWSNGPANGTASYYAPVAASVTFTPSLGVSPGALTRWGETRILFDRVAFRTATVSLSNNYASTPDTITLDGTEQGLVTAESNASVRVWPSFDVATGSAYEVSVSHSQAGQPFALSGLSITHRPMSGRTNR